ncbi:MAG: oxaloacetate decarboxylase gamma chain [Gammaproteobacteria bacterium]|jgi:oxaloacetate decarboxylase gamma subunit|nr:oxaloacetate decarboxylase gamma chain [Gammaproteobacteria bacterium]|tara:strand:+ start:9763 stop:9996 length:234 start_codon:yes stop_codon:yes gene_type:complete
MENLMSQGLELAIFGMGTVFVFLTVLVLITQGMSALVLRMDSGRDGAGIVTQGSDDGLDGELVAVISAAIKQHRSSG